jgi:AraC-like DNA-binding protein
MNNLYEYNLQNNFRKLECEELLFVEFQCLPGVVRSGVWSQHGYIAYGLSGKKTWISPDGEFVVYKGDALYCKKGGQLVHHFYKEQFCALLFFFPDDFIRKIVLEFMQESPSKKIPLPSDAHIISMNVDLRLETFFESVMSYFLVQKNPSRNLLKLKFKELVLQVLSSNENPELAAYFFSLAKEEQANLKQIMLDNYLYHLNLDEFAKLCHRSLSTFKRDFKETFGQPPGKWLIERRMEYAKMRLLTTEESINDVAFHSGYQATSHFIRCFKKYFGHPPQQYRNHHSLLEK